VLFLLRMKTFKTICRVFVNGLAPAPTHDTARSVWAFGTRKASDDIELVGKFLKGMMHTLHKQVTVRVPALAGVARVIGGGWDCNHVASGDASVFNGRSRRDSRDTGNGRVSVTDALE
jgi:hypothetical protein